FLLLALYAKIFSHLHLGYSDNIFAHRLHSFQGQLDIRLNQFLLYLLFSFFITLPLHLFHTTLYFTHKTYSVNSPFVVRKQTHTNAHNHKSTIIALTPMLIFTKPRSSHTSPCS